MSHLYGDIELRGGNRLGYRRKGAARTLKANKTAFTLVSHRVFHIFCKEKVSQYYQKAVLAFPRKSNHC